MRWTKIRAAVAIACALLTTIGVASASAATTVTVLADSADRAGLDAVIYRFERANPDINVEQTYVANAQRAGLLTTQFQAGNAADVVMVQGGNGFPPALFPFAAAGYFDPISATRLRAQPVGSYIKPALTYKGKVYGRPMATNPLVFMDNLSLLKRLGLKRPETLGETIKLCGAIRAKAQNITPIGLPGTVPQLFSNFIVNQAMSEVYDKNPRWDQQRLANKVKFQTTPGWRSSVQNIKRLIDAKCFGPNVAGETFTQSAANLAEGKTALLWGGSAILNIARSISKSGDRFGMFQFPQKSKATTYVAVSPTSNLAVNKKARNLAGARKFLDFAASPAQNRIFAKINSVGQASAWERVGNRALDRNGLTKADIRANRKTLGPDFGFAAPYADRITISSSFYRWPNATEILVVMAQSALGLFTGQSTVDSVLKSTDAAWDRAAKR